jgi:hypothetical protein
MGLFLLRAPYLRTLGRFGLERFPAELNRGFPIVCERASLAALIRGSGGTKSMPKPYSDDLRERVIEAVVAGVSRREASRWIVRELERTAAHSGRYAAARNLLL